MSDRAGDRYDVIGRTYSRARRTDPRVAAPIWAALGDAVNVLNVGAGTGNYEPSDRAVTALEPSSTMLAQRAPGAAPAVQGEAERLPFPDRSFDAALAVLTVHHWHDLGAGLRELRRVAPRQVVFTFEPGVAAGYWLLHDYFPECATLATERRAPSLDDLRRHLDIVSIETVPVPADCVDGFGAAYWRRPEAYLDADVLAGMSHTAQLPPEVIERGTARLAADLASGRWEERYGHLRDLDELDMGYRLVLAED